MDDRLRKAIDGYQAEVDDEMRRLIEAGEAPWAAAAKAGQNVRRRRAVRSQRFVALA